MMHAAIRTPHSALERGQALLELAVFGSLLIMLLGALINYGLHYDFQQQAAMTSFRQALKLASDPLPADPVNRRGDASYLLVNDRHFPHPASPFATGSIIPGSASASVIRNFAMHKVPDRVDELPRLTLNVEGSTTCPGSLLSPPGSKPPCEYLTANFRTEFNVPKGSLDRYREIYDRVCARTDCGGAGCGVKDDGSEVCQDTLKLRLIDSCEGEMINHDVCARQARQIVDQGVCKKECEKGKPPASQKDCAKICGAPMARPPWYAQGAVKQGGTWVFPKLDELFSGIRNMGLQPGYTKESQASHRLVITNNTSRTSGRWRETTTRTVISRQTGQTGRRLTQQITSEKIVPTDGTFSAR